MMTHLGAAAALPAYVNTTTLDDMARATAAAPAPQRYVDTTTPDGIARASEAPQNAAQVEASIRAMEQAQQENQRAMECLATTGNRDCLPPQAAAATPPADPLGPYRLFPCPPDKAR